MRKLIITPQGENYIDLTSAEIEQREQDAIKSVTYKVLYKQKIEQQEINKQSALTKLSALGLTEAEIKALIG